MLPDVPALEGILSVTQIEETAESIAAMQEPCGAIPWTIGEHTDIWNHVEGAMALLVGGKVAEAERAYEWTLTMQRDDGSWPMKIVAEEIEDGSGETNMSAYLAVGIWHHWLIRRDLDFVRHFWPAVKRGLDWVVSMQMPFGGIAWSWEWRDGAPTHRNDDALLAGSSSIYQSLRAGLAIAHLLKDPQPEWEMAGGRLGHALRRHRDLFLDKSEFSMDWYYPILGGAVTGSDGYDLIASRWQTFVEDDLGIRCVSNNPWVTGAETCELAMSLDNLGDHERAVKMFADMQHLRDTEGRYWTGYVIPDRVNWPVEHTTYTAAAVILAADALGHLTAGSDIMRGTSLAPHPAEIAAACGCPDSTHRVARSA